MKDDTYKALARGNVLLTNLLTRQFQILNLIKLKLNQVSHNFSDTMLTLQIFNLN